MKSARLTCSIAAKLLTALWAARLWWMIPVVLTLLVLAAVLIVAQGSAIAPFVYTLF